jgi:hypothetical protein
MSPRITSLVAAAAAAAGLAAAPHASACGSAGYTYAGVASATRTHGVAADITALGAPGVKGGHVAAWVGVGGPKQGPRRTDEWIQVGFSGFPGSIESSLYYEVTTPTHRPVYHELEQGLTWGATRRLAVLEVARRPNWWRVWVNGKVASAPVLLPGSHGAWRGIATTESWGGGSFVCNNFGYRFDRISVAQRPGGAWRRLASALPIVSGGYRFVRPHMSSFIATSGQLLKPVFRPLASSRPRPTGSAAAAVTAARPAPSPTSAVTAAPATPDPAAPAAPTALSQVST